MIINFNKFLNEKYLKNDAIGYNIGEFVYHVSPKRNLNKIKKYGLIPKDGISINGKPFKNRLYFATSLIAAYDLTVNFSSYKDNEEYIIFKLDSKCIKDYEKDNLFVHGIFINYPVDYKYVIDIINTNDLFNKYDENDLENLYL
jgi:hypothetical protein